MAIKTSNLLVDPPGSEASPWTKWRQINFLMLNCYEQFNTNLELHTINYYWSMRDWLWHSTFLRCAKIFLHFSRDLKLLMQLGIKKSFHENCSTHASNLTILFWERWKMQQFYSRVIRNFSDEKRGSKMCIQLLLVKTVSIWWMNQWLNLIWKCFFLLLLVLPLYYRRALCANVLYSQSGRFKFNKSFFFLLMCKVIL